MLSFNDRPARLCDGISRRQWLRVGGLGAFGVGLPQLPSAAAEGSPEPGLPSFGKAKACIVLFLLGGPPQHETWDPKPDAPPEIRGDLDPIASAVPGLAVGELMPRVARLTDRIAVLRAVSTADNAHSSSGYWMLTGYPHQPTNRENAKPGAPNDWPTMGAVVKHLSAGRGPLPAAVRLPEEIWNTGRIVWPGQDAGWLGHRADPWYLECDPNAADFRVPDIALPREVPPARLHGRTRLLESIEAALRQSSASGLANDLAPGASGGASRWTGLRRKAFELLDSPTVRDAFAVDREPAKIRERYGRNRFGQSVLLARRLVESGVRLVQVNWTRGKEDENVAPAWDSHAKNTERLKTALMPPMDLAYSALLEDLEARGLLDETLIVWMGEFGRTPKINPRGGRDHWGHVFSLTMAGGGIAGGRVHGASDAHGAYPAKGRVQPQDVTATVFHCLGIDPHTALRNQLGRPMFASNGKPIAAIL